MTIPTVRIDAPMEAALARLTGLLIAARATLVRKMLRRQLELPNGKVAKEEVVTGARRALLSARSHSGLSQAEFAAALGVSKRKLENWEQGRAEPTGPAKVLLNLVARYPDTVKRLAKIRPEEMAVP